MDIQINVIFYVYSIGYYIFVYSDDGFGRPKN